MPRKRKPYSPVADVLLDGTTIVRTGIYVESRRRPFTTFAEVKSYVEQSCGPKPSFDEVLATIEMAARDLLIPHIRPEPMTRDEVRAAKDSIKGQLPPGEVRNTPFVADVRDGNLQFFSVLKESQLLPVIGAASEVLQYVRRIRKSGSQSFLAGLELGQLVERMFVRAVEPEFIGKPRVARSNRDRQKQVGDSLAERNAKIAKAVDAGIRDGRKREAVYRTVGDDFELEQRQIREIYRQSRL